MSKYKKKEIITFSFLPKLNIWLCHLLTIFQISDGFSVFEITTSESDKSQQKICNISWQVTTNITQIIIPDKTPESNDDCYCMIYHPLNQTLLNRLVLDIDHTNVNETGNNFEHWMQLAMSNWYNDKYKIPVFRIRGNNPSSSNRNYFYITTNNTEVDTFAPVKITFKQFQGNNPVKYTEPLYLSCSQSSYVLPDILITTPKPTVTTVTTKQTSAAKSEMMTPTTALSETSTDDTNGSNNQTEGGDTNTDPQKTVDTDDDNTTIIIAAVVGAAGGFLFILLIVIIIILCCRKKKKSVARQPYSTRYYDEVNHNLEIRETPNGQAAFVGGIPSSSSLPTNAYVNSTFHPDPDLSPYSVTNNNSPPQQMIPRVHYAEIEIQPSARTSPERQQYSSPTGVTYADVDFQNGSGGGTAVSQGASTSHHTDAVANPVYAQSQKKLQRDNMQAVHADIRSRRNDEDELQEEYYTGESQGGTNLDELYAKPHKPSTSIMY